jgi:hypothetical protein
MAKVYQVVGISALMLGLCLQVSGPARAMKGNKAHNRSWEELTTLGMGSEFMGKHVLCPEHDGDTLETMGGRLAFDRRGTNKQENYSFFYASEELIQELKATHWKSKDGTEVPASGLVKGTTYTSTDRLTYYDAIITPEGKKVLDSKPRLKKEFNADNANSWPQVERIFTQHPEYVKVEKKSAQVTFATAKVGGSGAAVFNHWGKGDDQ